MIFSESARRVLSSAAISGTGLGVENVIFTSHLHSFLEITTTCLKFSYVTELEQGLCRKSVAFVFFAEKGLGGFWKRGISSTFAYDLTRLRAALQSLVIDG